MGLPMDSPITDLVENKATSQLQQRSGWLGIAKDLAEAFSCPIAEVEQLLRTEVQQIEEGARIKEYVLTLAVKRVKELLRVNGRFSEYQTAPNHPSRLLRTLRGPYALHDSSLPQRHFSSED